MKTFANFGLIASAVLALFAGRAMGNEPSPGGGLQPPVEPRQERGLRPPNAAEIVDVEGVDEPVTVEMSDVVRVTGRGNAGAQITIEVKGAGKLNALNNVRKVKEGIGSHVKEFMISIRRELLDLAKHYYGPQGQGANYASIGNDSAKEFEQADSGEDNSGLAAWPEFHRQAERLPDELAGDS